MPHDSEGREVKVGDEVTIKGRVKDVQVGDEYCNVTVEIGHEAERGPHNVQNTVVLNTKQVTTKFTPIE